MNDASSGYCLVVTAVLASACSAGDFHSVSGWSELRSTNAVQQTSVVHRASGTRVSSLGSTAHFDLQLLGVGHGAVTVTPPGTDPVRHEGRVELRHAGVVEWYRNRDDGLEQGFVIETRPLGGGDLVVAVAVAGADVRVAADGREALLDTGSLSTRVHELHAFDARGRELPARFVGHRRALHIMVDDAGAEYPISIDPLYSVEAKIIPTTSASGDNFGIKLAANGSTVIGLSNTGAHVFIKSGSTWTQQTTLTAGTGRTLSRSVALSGDTAVIGGMDGSQFAAFVFVRSGTSWSLQQMLKGSSPTSDYFGCSVGIDGDRVIVGAHPRPVSASHGHA